MKGIVFRQGHRVCSSSPFRIVDGGRSLTQYRAAESFIPISFVLFLFQTFFFLYPFFCTALNIATAAMHAASPWATCVQHPEIRFFPMERTPNPEKLEGGRRGRCTWSWGSLSV